MSRKRSSHVEFKPKAVLTRIKQERGRRHELESVVAQRTMELELRNALLRILSSPLAEEGAYFTAMDAILGLFKADAILIAYYDGWQALKCVSRGTGGLESTILNQASIELLRRASRGEGIEIELLGPGIRYRVVISLEVDGDQCGFTAIGREEADFTEEERGILSKVFASFSIHAKARKEQARTATIQAASDQALRRSEERLSTFFAESKDMIYFSNADDIVASINNAGLELLGIADRFEIVGRPFADHLLSAEDRHLFLVKLKERGFVTDYECVFQRKDGSTLFGLETASAVRGKDGRLVEIQGIVKDITDRIADERELWKANLELAEANEKLKSTQMIMIQHEKLASIGQLAAGIAHEINNPLGFLSSNQTTISGFLRLLRQAWTEATAMAPEEHAEIAKRLDLEYVLEEIEALISESDEGFKRIIDIVQNLKTFARVDSKPVMGQYDLNEGIKSTLVVVRNELKYVAEVELDLEPMPPMRALGSEINQVVLNILVNAAQAIEAQGRKDKGRILVTTRLEGDWVILAIADDGPGIPEESRLKVFDPFYTTKPPGKGTGLGLSISYDIVTRKHGGTISLGTSDLGGALFTITLPVGGPPPAPEDAKSAP
jgi:PAS domain S-box-containing protein